MNRRNGYEISIFVVAVECCSLTIVHLLRKTQKQQICVLQNISDSSDAIEKRKACNLKKFKVFEENVKVV